jgi:hypothetical protein
MLCIASLSARLTKLFLSKQIMMRISSSGFFLPPRLADRVPTLSKMPGYLLNNQKH